MMSSSLQHCLEEATQSNGNWTKKRIQSDITVHYDEAYRVAVVAGHTEAEAEAQALESLGDATSARKRFRKSHWTTNEERHLQNLIVSRYSGFPTLFMYSLMAFIASKGEMYSLMMIFILCGGILFWNQRRLARGHLRLLVLAELTMLPLFLFIIWVNFYENEGTIIYKFWPVLLIHSTTSPLTCLRIMRKSHKEFDEEAIHQLSPNISLWRYFRRG